MKEWLKISLLLCLFGLMRDNRPSEVFVTEFLTDTRWRNVTQEEVNRDVYPVGTYSYAAQLVLVFLVTDFLRYKPLIILIGICGIIIWSLLIWTTSLEALQAVEFFYGTYMAAEVAYYTYIYAKVDKKYYSRITSHARAAMLCGKLIAGISSQLLVNYKLMDYRQLNYITLASQICATIWAFLLPGVDRSLYFHRKGIPSDISPSESSQQINHDLEAPPKHLSAFGLLWSHLRNAYTNPKVIQWSLWYGVGLCGHLQIVNYIQVLWKHTGNNPPIAWNGAVESVLTFLGAVSSLAAGYIHAGRLSSRSSLLLLVGLSLLEGSAVLLSAWTPSLYLCYAGYIIFGVLFAFTITVASAEVAKHLEEDSYGLVFGINTFFAVILQSILTMIVVSASGLGLDIVQQFTVYAFYFVIIGLVYLVALIAEYIWSKMRNGADIE